MNAAVARPRRQRGVVMYVAIVVLLIMTIAGVAMMRQMGTGVSIAGNLAFKQNTTSMADLGTENARVWLVAHAPDLYKNCEDPCTGYFSSGDFNFRPVAHDWDAASITAPNVDDGTVVRYVIHRLCHCPNVAVDGFCPVPGVPANDWPKQDCVSEPGIQSNKGAQSTLAALPPPPQPYFRVTTRVDGVRNSMSYIQVILGPNR